MLLQKEKRRWRNVGKRSMTLMIVIDQQKNIIVSKIKIQLKKLTKLF